MWPSALNMLAEQEFQSEARRWPHLVGLWKRCSSEYGLASWDWEWIWHETPEVTTVSSNKDRLNLSNATSLLPRRRAQYLELAHPVLMPRYRSARLLSYESEKLWKEDSTVTGDEGAQARVEDKLEKPSESEDEGGWEEGDVLTGDELTAAICQDNADVQEWKIHIVYSETWRVPVLYFNARHVDGCPACWEEVCPFLPESLRESISVEDTQAASWPFVTQEIHPGTGEPWFMLHPCQTAARMESLVVNNKYLQEESNTSQDRMQKRQYLLPWFCMVSHCMGLSVPPRFFQESLTAVEPSASHSRVTAMPVVRQENTQPRDPSSDSSREHVTS